MPLIGRETDFSSSPLFGSVTGRVGRICAVPLGFTEAHRPLSTVQTLVYLCVRDSVTQRHRATRTILMSLISLSYDYPQRLFRPPPSPRGPRPSFLGTTVVLYFKISNVRFDDHPPLVRHHAAGASRVRPDGENGPRCSLRPAPYVIFQFFWPRPSSFMTGCTRYRTPSSTLCPLVEYFPVHWNAALY